MKHSENKQKGVKAKAPKWMKEKSKKKKSEEKPLPENEEALKEKSEENILNSSQLSAEEELKKVKKDYLYLTADFENYKKQSLKEKRELIRYAGESFILSLIDEVIDDLERAFEIYKQEDSLSNFKKGIDLVYKKLQRTLQSHGVNIIDPTGTLFDPSEQEAIGRQKNSDVPADHIIITFKKVYKLYDKVIRHGQVIVSQKETTDNEPS